MNLRYGKAAVTFYRTDGQRGIFAAEVRLDASGDNLLACYTEGDNSLIVATDSMKNFIHAMALEYRGASLEEFLAFLGGKFLATYPHTERIGLAARELPFTRERGSLFSRRHDEYTVADLTMDRTGILEHRCGLEALRLIKLTGSAFTGFIRDAYTTLPEMPDRPLLVHMNVYWRHRRFDDRVGSARVRDVVTEVFDGFVSQSIQHLVHEIGQRLLAQFPAIVEVAFEAENHLWDAALAEPGAPTRVYTDPRPPYGVIGLTLTRQEGTSPRVGRSTTR
ncbi:MAG: factor-independent urate hydroxylase [bacterium]